MSMYISKAFVDASTQACHEIVGIAGIEEEDEYKGACPTSLQGPSGFLFGCLCCDCGA